MVATKAVLLTEPKVRLEPRPSGKPAVLGGIGPPPPFVLSVEEGKWAWPAGSYDMDEWMYGICTIMFFYFAMLQRTRQCWMRDVQGGQWSAPRA